MKQQTICVIGLGYIGLPTASLIATKGFNVHGVDINESVVAKLNQGEIHIVEPGLDTIVKSATQSGNLKCDTQPTAADIFMIAVPTPFDEDHNPDLSYVEAAAKAISPYLRNGNLVILESTSPVGTTQFMSNVILNQRPELTNLYVAHCPERVIPGHVIRELVENDRVVGGLNTESTEAAVNFYQQFVEGEVIPTDAETAEMCKLAENTFRDVNIAFANELSIICNNMGIDVWKLIKLANRHPRVNILQPGPGVGGHCIAVDPWFIVASDPENAKLVRQARLVNDSKPKWVIQQVTKAARNFKTPNIACLGVTFKADIDDIRESPALAIASYLQQNLDSANIMVCEPNLGELSGFSLVSLELAVEQADIILLLVDHHEFKQLSPSRLANKVVIDTKGIWSCCHA